MDKLLNELIARGWKPRGKEITNKNYKVINEYSSINDLCSIDSGLWQFVCEKGLLPKEITTQSIVTEGVYDRLNYNYRLMLSSIQPNKEKFILDNIKV